MARGKFVTALIKVAKAILFILSWPVRRYLPKKHGDVKSFDRELKDMGGSVSRRDGGVRIVPTTKIVGSVGRARNLRSDFFYKYGKAMTNRFVRVGEAMKQGKILPLLELYKLKRKKPGSDKEVSEYYVVDGHHRVAMARKIGQDYFDAHIVEYKVSPKEGQKPDQGTDASAASPEEKKPPAGPEASSTETKPESK